MEIVRKMNEQARNDRVREFVEWALPVQEKHVEATREGALTLAAEEDPNSTE